MRKLPDYSRVRTLTAWLAIACLQLAALAAAGGTAAVADGHAGADTLSVPGAGESAARTWRIMPIGDSITEAEGPYNSYRRPLWQMLNDAGIDTDFVGSRSGNRDGQVPNPDFDTDHEGHWGWRADRFLRDNNIQTWSQTYVPDVILIHLGTNDIFQGQGVSGTINDIGQIIDIVRDANPRVIVLVAQIIPTSDPSRPSLEPFNEAIPELVSSRDSADSPVRLVDQYTGFDATVDTYDGVHPDVSGENKMAQKWFDALQPLLSQNMNEAPRFTSTPVTSATQDAPYSYVVTVADPDSDTIGITASQKPDWLILVDNGDGTAALSGTPGNSDVGDNAVKLVATDSNDLATEQTFTINVADVNDAPVFTSLPVTVASEAAPYSYTASAEDPDAANLQITALTLPNWLTLDDNNDGTATLNGVPTGAEVGTHTVELEARETGADAGRAAQQSFIVRVSAAPEGPVITLIGDSTVTIAQGDMYNDPGATASDLQDGDLTARIVTDNPVESNVAATYAVTYSVADSAGNAAQAERTVVVRAGAVPGPQASSGGGGTAGILELLALLILVLGAQWAAMRARKKCRHPCR
jgi:acyl-CoA thioesterase-1